MAIYDHNGSVSAEIGKLYDHDGAVSSQISKVYDHNGAVSSLIYTAEQQVFPPRTTSWISQNGSGNSQSDSLIKAQCNGSSVTNAQMYTVLDFTGWQTLRFTANCSYAGNAWAGLTIDNIGYTGIPSGTKGIAYPNGTYDIDVSQLNGNHTVYLCAWGSTGASTINLTNLILL